jgi:hypothetical protein
VDGRDKPGHDGVTMTSRTATLIGLTAILMWSLLAVLTVATGRIPAFQLAAMTFAIGALAASVSWIARPGAIRSLKQPPIAWIVGVGGLFGYHALYFLALRLAPPAEAGLLNYLWPLLIVLFSSLLPGERLKPYHIIGALLGLVGTILLFAGNTSAPFERGQIAGLAAAFVAAFVWAAYSVMSRKLKGGADRCGGGLLFCDGATCRCDSSGGRSDGLARHISAMAGHHRPRRRPGGCCVLCVGYRHEARRYPRAGRGVLRDAAALDRVFDRGGLCQAKRGDCRGRGVDCGRRVDRGQRYDRGTKLGRRRPVLRRSSNFAKSNPGATVHPTSVQSPQLSAACHACAGTTACGASPAARSGPSRILRQQSPSTTSSISALPA